MLTVAQWMWLASVSATVLVALIALAQVLFGRIAIPRFWLALWWLVAVRLALPIVPASPTSVFNAVQVSRTEVVNDVRRTILSAETVAAGGQKSPPYVATSVPKPNALWPGMLLYLWLAGALTFLTAVLLQHWRLQRWLRRETERVPPPLTDIFQACRTQLHLRRTVSLAVTAAVDTPAAFGVIHPRVLLPRHLLQALSEEELRLLLLHELLHVKRHDVLQNWILILLQAIHWFNPAIWFAFRRLRSQRELVCDAAVLGLLAPASRQVYGTTLIRLAELAARPFQLPTIVPILSHKKQIHRRIVMISAYKPTTRLALIGSAIIVVALACAFLTRAADKLAPAPATNEQKLPFTDAKSAKAYEILKPLREEFHRLSGVVKDQSHKVDRLKEELQISDLEEAASEKSDSELLRRFEALRMKMMADYQRLNTLNATLTNLSRRELLSVLPTTYSDALLQELLSRQSLVEQKYAEGLEQRGVDHPENKVTRRTLQQVAEQINSRADAIMHGLQIKVASQRKALDHLESELKQVRENQISRPIRQRPYFQAKRELQTLEAARDRLHERLLQAEVDAALAPMPAK